MSLNTSALAERSVVEVSSDCLHVDLMSDPQILVVSQHMPVVSLGELPIPLSDYWLVLNLGLLAVLPGRINGITENSCLLSQL